jgi:hypothetical protein
MLVKLFVLLLSKINIGFYINGSNILLKKSNPLLLKKFGELHKDKIFYVIQQESKGRGLFSLLSSLIYHVDLANKFGFEYVVDLKNFKTEYHDSEISYCLWELLFEPINKFTLDEVYKSNCVFISSNGFPNLVDFDISKSPGLFSIYHNYFKFNNEILNMIKIHKNNLDCDLSDCLGVHFRGREQRTARGHHFPPTLKQMCKVIDAEIINNNYKKIFIVTEDPLVLNKMKIYYGDRLIYANVARSAKNIYKLKNFRANNKEFLAKEVLVEVALLSQCRSFVGSVSNVSNFTIFINNGRFIFNKIIINPKNSTIPGISKFMWFIRSALPQKYGGFPLN